MAKSVDVSSMPVDVGMKPLSKLPIWTNALYRKIAGKIVNVGFLDAGVKTGVVCAQTTMSGEFYGDVMIVLLNGELQRVDSPMQVFKLVRVSWAKQAGYARKIIKHSIHSQK